MKTAFIRSLMNLIMTVESQTAPRFNIVSVYMYVLYVFRFQSLLLYRLSRYSDHSLNKRIALTSVWPWKLISVLASYFFKQLNKCFFTTERWTLGCIHLSNNIDVINFTWKWISTFNTIINLRLIVQHFHTRSFFFQT